jgi:hypothetical protein
MPFIYLKTFFIWARVVAHTCNSSTWELRKEDQEFEANLGYIVHSEILPPKKKKPKKQTNKKPPKNQNLNEENNNKIPYFRFPEELQVWSKTIPFLYLSPGFP